MLLMNLYFEIKPQFSFTPDRALDKPVPLPEGRRLLEVSMIGKNRN